MIRKSVARFSEEIMRKTSRERKMWNRREAVAGGMLTLLFGGCCHAETARTHTFGCCLASEDVDAVYPNGTDTRTFFTGNEAMIPRSGDRDFDYALAQTLAKISDAFGVLPGFAYYDDYDSHNAYATERTRLNRADGTVLMASTCNASSAPATIIPRSPWPRSAATSSAISCSTAIA
jgi:hypothetical protein